MKMFHTSVSNLIRDFSYLPVNCRYVIRNFCLCVYFRPHRSFYIFQENLTNQKSTIILLVTTWFYTTENWNIFVTAYHVQWTSWNIWVNVYLSLPICGGLADFLENPTEDEALLVENFDKVVQNWKMKCWR